MTMTTLDEIVETFEILGDWDQRYEYIVELGEQLPDMPQAQQIDANQVKGCMSLVYVCPYRQKDAPEKVLFNGFCDTAIIKGVLAILIQLVSDRTVQEIQDLDIDEVFERLNLADHLSPNRHVGIYAIVTLMKKLALDLDSKSAIVA